MGGTPWLLDDLVNDCCPLYWLCICTGSCVALTGGNLSIGTYLLNAVIPVKLQYDLVERSQKLLATPLLPQATVGHYGYVLEDLECHSAHVHRSALKPLTIAKGSKPRFCITFAH